MTIHLTLIFMLLMLEIGIFLLLIIPFPHSIRRKIFNFISGVQVYKNLKVFMVVTFFFISMFFLDSVKHVYGVQSELAAFHGAQNSNVAPAMLGQQKIEVQVKKFYSQRNMYLCGFTLFLSLILNRTYTMILEIIHLEERVKAFESNKPEKLSGDSAIGKEFREEVSRLKKELDSKNKSLEAMEKQAKGLSREYEKLSDEHSQALGLQSNKKED